MPLLAEFVSRRERPGARRLPWQLGSALGLELAALSPRPVNLAHRVPATKRDDGRDEREDKRADRSDDLQHDDDGDDGRDHGKNRTHVADYKAPLRPRPANLPTRSARLADADAGDRPRPPKESIALPPMR